MKGSQFLNYINPILSTLKEMGGAGVASEVIDKVVERLKIPESELEVLLPSGTQSRIRNQMHWARMYLTKGGYLDPQTPGTWKLTDKGMATELLSEEDILMLYRNVVTNYNTKGSVEKPTSVKPKLTEEQETEDVAHNHGLLQVILNLSPSGFERLCKRLLTECGFQQVEVTGRSGDHGIDGIGLLEINDLMNFKVLFQCKRFKETVGSSMVRDFRGAMQGRAEKGIILTTGRFTSDAKTEAKRDGVPPIELVDGEKLVSMFEKYKIGLIPKTVFDIDYSFFEEFK